MPNTHATLTSLFDDIADAIRAKTGDSSDIVADEFPDAIADISTGPADGRVWTSVDIPMTVWGNGSGFWITGIAYGNGKYVVVVNTNYGDGYGTGDPTKILYSSDLVNWTTVTLSDNRCYTDIAYGGGTFVLLATGGNENNAKIAYSTDLTNWTYITTSVSTDDSEMWDTIKYTDGLFIIVGDYGTTGVSTDLANWSYISGSGINYTNSMVALGDGRAIFPEYDGGTVIDVCKIKPTDPHITLVNAYTITIASGDTFEGWWNAFEGNGKYFIIYSDLRSNGNNDIHHFRIFTTMDGTNWSEPAINEDDGVAVGDGVYGDGKYIIPWLSDNEEPGYILFSTNGQSWEKISTPKMSKVIFGDGCFLGGEVSIFWFNPDQQTTKVTIHYSKTTT